MKKILIPFAFILAILSLRAQPGAIDTTFKADLALSNNLVVKTVLIQPDNRIIIAGYYGSRSSPSSPGNTLVRLTADGALDTSFNANSIPFYSCANNPYLYDLALQADGKILVGAAYNCNITRLDSNGTVDPTFNPLNSEYWGVFSFALQPDGKILVSNRDSVFRLNTDGSFDATFNSASLVYSVDSETASVSQVTFMTVQSDNKIILAGTAYPNTSLGRIDSSVFNGVARLNVNGTVDPTFNVSGQNYGNVNCVTLQPDGKILVGGDSLFRLNTDGSIDNSFNAQAILYPKFEISSIVVQADGKVIVGGSFLTNENSQSDLIRLNSDGSLDVTFNTGLSLAGVVSSLGLQTDGKIIIAGADSCLGCFPGPLVRLFGDSALLSVTILGRDTICSGDTTLMFANVISDNGPVTYSWSPAAGLSCSTCDSVYAQPDSTTTYTVIAQDSVNSDTAYLTVYVDPYTTPLIPTDSIYPLYDSVYLDTNRAFCLGPAGYFVAPIGFAVASKNGGVHPQYEWLVDSINVGITSDTFGVNNLPCCSGGTLFLSCQMTSSLGCVHPLTVISFTDTLYLGCNIEGISSPSVDDDVKIYPNPNNGTFLLSIDQPSRQLNIELYNIQGQRLYVEQLKDVPSVNKEFNFNDLAQAIYLMRITTENGTVVKRMAVQ